MSYSAAGGDQYHAANSGRFISRQPDRKRADVPTRHEVCPRASSLAETEDALGRKLAPEDHPLLAEYAMASAGLTSVSLEEAYIEGFRTGARIMLAVLQEDKPQESRDEDKA